MAWQSRPASMRRTLVVVAAVVCWLLLLLLRGRLVIHLVGPPRGRAVLQKRKAQSGAGSGGGGSAWRRRWRSAAIEERPTDKHFGGDRDAQVSRKPRYTAAVRNRTLHGHLPTPSLLVMSPNLFTMHTQMLVRPRGSPVAATCSEPSLAACSRVILLSQGRGS